MTMDNTNRKIVTEYWIKPPKIVTYTNAIFDEFENGILRCHFDFPNKYKEGGFYINNQQILGRNQMYFGRRIFYANRFYSLLTFYSIDNKVSGYYIDIVLPPIVKKKYVIIFDLKIDFFVLPDKKTYYILDRDELDNAIDDKLLSSQEIEVCKNTTSIIEDLIKKDSFDKIFTDYQKSSFDKWDVYNKYKKKFALP